MTVQLTKEHRTIAKEHGVSANLLYQRVHIHNWDINTAMTKKPRKKRVFRTNTMYVVYKNDNPVVTGNARQCAEYMGIKLNSFYHLLTPAYERRVKERNAKKYITVVEA